jgi:hypothetical protein
MEIAMGEFLYPIHNGLMKPVTTTRIRLAWLFAITVDALQIGLFPVSGGLITWLDIPLDFLATVVFWRLLGWHWALAPSFVFELLPIAELAPTWTLAIWIVTRQRKAEMKVLSSS